MEYHSTDSCIQIFPFFLDMIGKKFMPTLVLVFIRLSNCSIKWSNDSLIRNKFPNLLYSSKAHLDVSHKSQRTSGMNEWKITAIASSNNNDIPNNRKHNVSLHIMHQISEISEVGKLIITNRFPDSNETNAVQLGQKISHKAIRVYGPPIHYKRSYNIAFGIISSVALVVGSIGNSAVLIVSFLHWDELSRYKVVIALLAITDGLSCVLNFLHTFYVFFSDKWSLGVFLCKIIFTGMMVSSWLSSGFILTITIERFVGVVHSMKTKLPEKRIVYTCIMVNILLAITAGVPMVITTDVNNDGLCHNYAPRSIMIPYQWCLITIFVIVPVCAVFYLYFRIIYFLITQTRSSIALSREDLKAKRMKNNQRTVMIIVPIVVLFVICVLPLHAIELYIAYWSTSIKGSAHLFDVYKILGIIQNITFPLHACVNPIVYTIMDNDFRHDLLTMLRCQGKVKVQSSEVISLIE